MTKLDHASHYYTCIFASSNLALTKYPANNTIKESIYELILVTKAGNEKIFKIVAVLTIRITS